MRFGGLLTGLAIAVMMAVPSRAAEQFIPIAAYWTGPYAASGSAIGNGMADYYELLNIRDGGINGVRLVYEKCETAYKADRVVECYEKMKAKGVSGAPFFHPLSTDATYAILERSEKDRIPLLTIGSGRSDGSDGRVFPYLFPALTNYWSQSTAKIRFIAQLRGGIEKLKGMKIANLYHDSAYGKETIPVLAVQAERYGFEVRNFPVAHPGLDQKAIWLQIARQFRPDYVILRGWGVMNPTALNEAARVGFPADRIIGVWWSGSEEDTRPAGDAANGYYAAGFHAAGKDFPVIRDMIRHVYDAGKGSLDKKRIGTIYANRSVAMAMIGAEAIRDAMKMVEEDRPVTGAEVQAALEQLTFDSARLERLGATGLIPEFSMTCEDHEGGGPVRFLQWKDGAWTSASDWIETDQSIVRPLVEASAATYANEKGIALRCQ
ncbi:ABC transporter substrate-binding protein [Minwuia sp.]|uniref:ABC transporter substrate-binding protein n=1 Tax=Minwuia sp. TaxID=2493630 RepID=UPI003A8D1936